MVTAVQDIRFDVVQAWLDNVAYSHSRNENTQYHYRRSLGLFCDFIGKSPARILAEYESSSDREFKRQYAGYVRALISDLSHRYAVGTVSEVVVAIRSFFKYNDLPLGHVPTARRKVTYHNRDITKQEITEILSISSPRDRAFFCIMAQSGLRPITLCRLKMKHIQPDFDKDVVPCKIEVPQELAKGKYHSYFTFMGAESISYLRNYMKTRGHLNREDYLFTLHGKEAHLNRKSMSHIFRSKITKLKRKGIMDFETIKKGKPANVRMYNLRKFFRKYGGNAGSDYVNFWMGHSLNVDDHYFSRDVSLHRKTYADNAMPHLSLEVATPNETDKVIQKQAEEIKELKKQATENIELRKRVDELEKGMEKLLRLTLSEPPKKHNKK